MFNTITAMFDSRAEAEAAKDRLKAANIDADNVHGRPSLATHTATPAFPKQPVATRRALVRRSAMRRSGSSS